MKSNHVALVAAVAAFLFASGASAAPMLQLDIAGGTYDSASETIVTSDSSFTVYAYANTGHRMFRYATLLPQTYYLSVALTPAAGPAHASIGSFEVNGTVYDATADMTYGVPPIEANGTAAHDGGDLGRHDVYETFFVEIPFQMAPYRMSGEYDTAAAPGSGPISGWDMYYTAFEVDRAGLPAGYDLHFDLYTTRTRTSGFSRNAAADRDIVSFAPFSHDAGTVTRAGAPVPEPSAALIFAVGLLVARYTRKA